MVGVPKQPQFLLSAYFCLSYLQVGKCIFCTKPWRLEIAAIQTYSFGEPVRGSVFAGEG